jgi:hypothetical protein
VECPKCYCAFRVEFEPGRGGLVVVVVVVVVDIVSSMSEEMGPGKRAR